MFFDHLYKDRREVHPVTRNDNEWQGMTMSDSKWKWVTASDIEWHNEWQQMTMSHSEWQKVLKRVKTAHLLQKMDDYNSFYNENRYTILRWWY